jgi:hypothetical protein
MRARRNRVSRATAQRDLSDLVSRGILAQQGIGRGTYYVLVQEQLGAMVAFLRPVPVTKREVMDGQVLHSGRSW